MGQPYEQEPLSDCERLRPLLIAMSEEDVDAQQREEITAHLRACAACQKQYAFLASLPDALEAALPTPDTQLQARIMQAVRATPQRRVPHFAYMGAIAAALCCVFVILALLRGGIMPHMETEDNVLDNSVQEDCAADEPQFSPSYGALDKEEADATEMDAPTADADDMEMPDGADATEDAPMESTVPSLQLPMGTLRFVADGQDQYVTEDGAYTLCVAQNGDIYLIAADGQYAVCEAYEDGERVTMVGAAAWSCRLEFDAQGVTLMLWEDK